MSSAPIMVTEGSNKGATGIAANYLLTKEFIMKECVRQGFYRTPSCNEKLYLHHKGFDGIEPSAFKEYTDVKVLWLEGNCFSSLMCGKVLKPSVDNEKEQSQPTQAVDVEVDPLPPTDSDAQHATHTESTARCEDVDIFETMYPTLRQLFLHGNLFNEMPNLQAFERLDTINLSDNFIPTIQSFCHQWRSAEATSDDSAPSPQKSASGSVAQKGSEEAVALRSKIDKWAARCKHVALDDSEKCLCSTLSTLTMKNNHLKTVEDIAALLCFKNLSVLDLSSNKLEDGAGVLEILERMPNLKALQLSGNPCVRSITNYRKTIISRCKKLLYLDDRPVFDDERRLVTAWAVGGLDAEKKERQTMKQEEEERHQRRLREFREMMIAARGGDDTSTEEDTDSNPTPSSHSEDDDIAVSNKERVKAPLNKKPPTGTRVLSSNQPRRGQQLDSSHTEFYDVNYGSRSEAQQAAEQAGDVSIRRRPEDGEDGVAFGNFRVVPKATGSSSPGTTSRSNAPERKTGTRSSVQHADPMHMEQVSAPSMLPSMDDEDDDGAAGVWVPDAAK